MPSTKFFTNENENTLLNKIEGIFKYKNVHFFDALVGYFRASGYFRIRPFVDKAAEIRILVGINIDNLIYEANRKGLLFDPDAERSQEDFFRQIKKNIQEAEYDKKVEEGMTQLIHDITTRKVQIRVHPKQNIHAKIYIFREEEKHPHGYGAVITGSSNLTDAGLSKNFEFNVELRDNTDIEYASETFEKLWFESVEVGQEYVDKLKKETFLNDDFTPFQIYMKFLIEYFGKGIDFDPTSMSDLPKGFKRLNYQADAVSDGFNKMMKHNGFFLADVVGLGKTIVGTLIAKKFYYTNGFPAHRSWTLIVTPPALEGNWRETVDKFGLENYEIVTNGSLHKVKNLQKFDLVIVDEAHKFRTDTADMYNQLQKICKAPTRQRLMDDASVSKKVILISATPLNNRPEDIANLVYLFQDSKDSTLEIGNLQHFFRQQIDAYRKVKDEKDLNLIREAVKIIYERIRVKVIEPLTVRRTRTDLKDHDFYKKDLDEQGIKFPNVQKPEKILYVLNDGLEQLYDQTMRLLSHPTEGVTYYRYQAIKYLKPPKKDKYRKADMISEQLAKLMKTLLVKRLDSSFHAFKQSLQRFKSANTAMMKMFEKGAIYIAPNLNVNEYINNDKEDELLEILLERMEIDPTIEICTPEDFDEELLRGLKHDQKVLDKLVNLWDAVEEDPKFDEFLNYLNTKLLSKPTNYEGKLVVFSESKETTNYLKKQLKDKGFDKILIVDSSNRKDLMPVIKANFDANAPIASRKNDFDIVISTEVLAEGVNLHRANVIVNYDTPWNATRLMQRIGRVNRIGSEADEIHIFNFFPTAKVDKDIDLEKKAVMKLAAFHAALGEDSQIFSPDEEFETFGLFDKDLDEERDEKLSYLMMLRKFKEDSPELFKNIKNLPLRARVGRKNKVLKSTTLAFIRNQRRDAFFFLRDDNSIEELTFLEAVRIFEAAVDEKAIQLHDLHHEQVKTALYAFVKKIEEEKAKDRKVDVTQGPNEKKALTYLDAFMNFPFLSEMDKMLILKAKEAIRLGKFQNLQRDINKLQKFVKSSPMKPVHLLDKLVEILKTYPLNQNEEKQQSNEEMLPVSSDILKMIFNPEIIISESFDIA
jgi:superfamily II DNA or RNA helicase/HKD family nuclease